MRGGRGWWGGIACGALLLGCAPPVPPSQPSPAASLIAAVPPVVFDAVVVALADWNLVLAHTDRVAGVVSTAERRVWWSDTLATRLAGWLVCVSRDPLEEYRVKLSVTLQPAGPAMTRLRVELSAQGVDGIGSGATVWPCTSTGGFEDALAATVRARAGG